MSAYQYYYLPYAPALQYATPSAPTTPVDMAYPVFQPQYASPTPSQPQSPKQVVYTPTNYHMRKCTGPDNMGSQCLPRIHTSSPSLYECMYCALPLMVYVPGQAAHLVSSAAYTSPHVFSDAAR